MNKPFIILLLFFSVLRADDESSELFPLQSIPYKTAERALKPFLSDVGVMAYIEESRSILIYDKNINLEKCKKILESIDFQEEARIFPLHSLSFRAVKPILEPLLKPKGTIGYLSDRNSIIVYGSDRVISAVEERLRKIVRPIPNIRILLDYHTHHTQNDSGVSVGIQTDSRGIDIIRDGRFVIPQNIRITGSHQGIDQNGFTGVQLLTRSGGEATLFVGEERLDPVMLNRLLLQHKATFAHNGRTLILNSVYPDIASRKLGVKLKVAPKAVDDDLIEVSVYPEISFMDKNGEKNVVFMNTLSSTVTLRNGESVLLSQVIKSNDSELFQLFGLSRFSKEKNGRTMNAYITALIE